MSGNSQGLASWDDPHRNLRIKPTVDRATGVPASRINTLRVGSEGNSTCCLRAVLYCA